MPDDRDAKERVEELRDAINRHDRLYFVENAPEISDAEYDRKLSELEELEQEHPDLVTEDSPTQRVGAAPVSKLEKVDHVAPDAHPAPPDARRTRSGVLTNRLRDETGRGPGRLFGRVRNFDGLFCRRSSTGGVLSCGPRRGGMGGTGEDNQPYSSYRRAA